MFVYLSKDLQSFYQYLFLSVPCVIKEGLLGAPGIGETTGSSAPQQ